MNNTEIRRKVDHKIKKLCMKNGRNPEDYTLSERDQIAINIFNSSPNKSNNKKKKKIYTLILNDRIIDDKNKVTEKQRKYINVLVKNNTSPYKPNKHLKLLTKKKASELIDLLKSEKLFNIKVI